MSTSDTTTDATVDPDLDDDVEELPEHEGVHQGYSDAQYIIVAAILAVATALEVAVSYIDIGALFLPTLLVLMAVKFLTVVQLFMHLKFDSKIFSWLFFSGLLLALGVYVAMLAAFHVFTG